MKGIRRRVLVFLLLIVMFCMVSCGKQGTVGGKKEQIDTTIYRISKVVEKTASGETLYTAEYDDEGKPVFYKVTSANELIATVELKYNDHSLLESVKIVYPNWDEIEMTQFSYDIDGNVIKEINSDENGVGSCYEYLYDNTNNSVETYERNEDGSLSLQMIKHYNHEKQLVLEEFYQKDGTFNFKRVYSYNDKGDITSYQGVDHNGMQLFLWEYENTYNKKGELVKVKTVEYEEEKESIRTDEYVYDDQGNKVNKISSSGVNYEWTYDGNGNVLSETGYRMQADGYAYKREFSYVTYNSSHSQKGKTFDITEMIPSRAF